MIDFGIDILIGRGILHMEKSTHLSYSKSILIKRLKI